MDGIGTNGLREMTDAEQRRAQGGVLPGGCVDPRLQQLLQIGTVPGS